MLSIPSKCSLKATIAFYRELLLCINSFNKIQYLSKLYVRSEILMMILGDSSTFSILFQNSFVHEECMECWLEITKAIILNNSESVKFISKFATIYYSLNYHLNAKINGLSNFILSKISKKNKLKTVLIQLFSKNY